MPEIVSAAELELVQETIDLVNRTQPRFASLMRANLGAKKKNLYPIPFFGSLVPAKVITFGLNPSAQEFATKRSWPPGLSAGELAARLVGYFHGVQASAHPWFGAWSRSLAVLGSSYLLDAAHIDLSPRPTASVRTFGEEALRSRFLEMLVTDAPIWIRALDAARNAKVVLLAGSATNSCYANVFMQERLGGCGVNLLPRWKPGRGEGQTAWQNLVLPNGREIDLFFCSSGPSKPAVLIDAVSRNAERIRKLLT